MKSLSARCAAFGMAVVVLLVSSVSFAQPYVELGPPDSIMPLDMPRVTVEVYTPDPEHSFGPDSNWWLLDTGAQGLLSAGTATTEMKSEGYVTEGTYNELGIGGTTTYDVSAEYHFDFAGSNGARNTLSDVRIMSSDSAYFGSFGGIVGMPAMVNRVTTLDLRPMACEDLLDLEVMDVGFGNSVPADDGHRYNVPLHLVHFPAQGNEPLPTYAPLPFLDINFHHASNHQTSSIILDTGAQVSMLSSQIAASLGLDADNDGDFFDDAVTTQEFGGVGGSIVLPVVQMDRLAIPTDEGIDMVWTDVLVAVVDIDPAINGVIGSDLLTGGYIDAIGTNECGYFEQVHFDFLDSENLTGAMVLDLNPQFDIVTTPEPTTLTLLTVAAWPLRRRKRRA